MLQAVVFVHVYVFFILFVGVCAHERMSGVSGLFM